MGIISSKLRDEIVKYSKRSVKKLLNLEHLGPYELSVLIIVLGQLIYAVCAPNCIADDNGDYYVTRFVVEASLPVKWKKLAGSVVINRNTLCHFYGSEKCMYAIADTNKSINDIRKLAEYMLTLN